MLTDVEIAQSTVMEPIKNVAEKIGLTEDDLELYGKYKAKISLETIKKVENNPDGKLILVTAINISLKGTIIRTCVWNKRWSNWWRICSSCSNGRYKPSFYR